MPWQHDAVGIESVFEAARHEVYRHQGRDLYAELMDVVRELGRLHVLQDLVQTLLSQPTGQEQDTFRQVLIS
jgi:hypothetical protein